jgi:hypothetical protein
MLTAAAPAVLTAENVLARIFCDSGSISRGGNREEYRVHVLTQGAEPRWIIIGSPSKAMPVLKSWAPWKKRSRLQWNAVRMAAAMNALAMLPGMTNSAIEIDASWWRATVPSFPKEWSAVIHVGSPSYTRKAILFVIEGGARVVCAAKVPLAPESAAAILNEADMLERLSRFDYLPRVLFCDRARGVAGQSWLEGRPVGRGFTEAHLDLLNSLVCAEGCVRVSDCRAALVRGLKKADFPYDRSVLARGMEMLDCDVPLACFVEHRDFAPWNLKWIGKGALGLLDWEWAEADGLPWQDACRYFYLDDVHFNGTGCVWETLMADPLLQRYCRRFDIRREALPALTMRYLIRELLMEWEGGNQRLADYAYRQIRSLLDVVSPVR